MIQSPAWNRFLVRNLLPTKLTKRLVNPARKIENFTANSEKIPLHSAANQLNGYTADRNTFCYVTVQKESKNNFWTETAFN